MNYIEYCETLKSGDRIVVPMSLLFSHHAIFWGWDEYGQGWIIENNKQNGVQFVRIEDFFCFINGIITTYAFVGSEEERSQAKGRAENAVGTGYHITNWNCEQFANYVQLNEVKSPQVRNTILTAIGVGIWLGGRQ